MEMEFKFDLGSMLKDTISGFSGVVVARTEWLYGCKRYGLTPKKLKDDKPIESQWFDEPQLILIVSFVENSSKSRSTKPTHGPKNDPTFGHISK